MSRRPRDKRMTIDEVVARLEDGMTIGIGGWGPRRKPMALVREILRSPLKDLTVVAYGGADVGMLCAAGKVKKLVFAFVSLDAIPLEPWFRKAREAGQIVTDALARNPLFIAAALPLRIFPPLFNSYGEGQAFDTHVDNAIRIQQGTGFRVRSDLSMTVFLAAPEEYDGGELTVETNFGVQQVKLPAGHAVLYPSSSLHRVEPVTRGCRVASFFWIESMVREDNARQILFDLDCSIQQLAAQLGQGDPEIIRLTGVYHNLLRKWAAS